jgi:hypothetical protein
MILQERMGQNLSDHKTLDLLYTHNLSCTGQIFPSDVWFVNLLSQMADHQQISTSESTSDAFEAPWIGPNGMQ